MGCGNWFWFEAAKLATCHNIVLALFLALIKKKLHICNVPMLIWFLDSKKLTCHAYHWECLDQVWINLSNQTMKNVFPRLLPGLQRKSWELFCEFASEIFFLQLYQQLTNDKYNIVSFDHLSKPWCTVDDLTKYSTKSFYTCFVFFVKFSQSLAIRFTTFGNFPIDSFFYIFNGRTVRYVQNVSLQ